MTSGEKDIVHVLRGIDDKLGQIIALLKMPPEIVASTIKPPPGHAPHWGWNLDKKEWELLS